MRSRRRAEAAAKVGPDSQFIRQTLGLDVNARDFQLVYGVQPRNDHEIAVLTRSMFEIMIDMATGVEPAAADLAALEQTKGAWIGPHGKFTGLMKQLGTL